MPSLSNKHNANGSRRRQLRARILATATHCALCERPLNTAAKWPDLDCTVIDEDIARKHGGSPLDPSNTNAMHNQCNRWKSTLTLAQARQLVAMGAVIGVPLSRQQRKAAFMTGAGSWEAGASEW